MLLSTDAEKAFHRVSWLFMNRILQHIGLRDKSLGWIKAKYSTPMARIRINGMLSDHFTITNGHYGYPLSPLLFVLNLEPFLWTIRHTSDIQGIQLTSTSVHRVSAFADDLLFIVTSPTTTLPLLLEEFQTHGKLSNFCINLTKSEALNVSIAARAVSALNPAFPYRWSPSYIKSLGTLIPADLFDTFAINFPPPLKKIKQDLQSWFIKSFSWFRRCNLLKINKFKVDAY